MNGFHVKRVWRLASFSEKSTSVPWSSTLD